MKKLEALSTRIAIVTQTLQQHPQKNKPVCTNEATAEREVHEEGWVGGREAGRGRAGRREEQEEAGSAAKRIARVMQTLQPQQRRKAGKTEREKAKEAKGRNSKPARD